jgi:undecaprenyl-diphosphatase
LFYKGGLPVVLQKLVSWDEVITRRCYFALQQKCLITTLQKISWLGDGPIWLVLIIGGPIVQGEQGFYVSVAMLLAALINVLCFRPIKYRIKRLRPFERFADMTANTKVGGQYSFPSSHATHAVSFLMSLGAFQPSLVVFMGVFVLVIALSRVILGVHYLGDIIIAAVLGIASGMGSVWVVSYVL